MNIIMLSYWKNQNARFQTNSHLNIQIKEFAQILSSAIRLGFSDKTIKKYDDKIYKLYSKNNPTINWILESKSNYEYLCELGLIFNEEFKFRNEKKHDHKSAKLIKKLPEPELPDSGLTYFPVIVPEYYKMVGNVVECYRSYIANEKSHLHKWTKRKKPFWIDNYKTGGLEWDTAF